jgi:DNA-binding transcriptional LysR family regulator
VPKHDCAYRMKQQRDLAAANVDTAAVLEMNSVAAVVQCLRAGLGVAFLPERAVARDIARGRLVKLRWHEPLVAKLFFIRHRDKPLVGAYGAFVKAVKDYFAEVGQGEAGLPGGVPRAR